ncbi:MAG: hypothetical protein D6722_08205 [Bacteroidetes bacterium]|nr:MAG: hypothetical protein D6722_08205 [Bacteroidota bacterium]
MLPDQQLLHTALPRQGDDIIGQKPKAEDVPIAALLREKKAFGITEKVLGMAQQGPAGRPGNRRRGRHEEAADWIQAEKIHKPEATRKGKQP